MFRATVLLRPVTNCMDIQEDTRRGERIYEDEGQEYSNEVFKDAIRTEWMHVEDKGYFDSLGELLSRTCTGSLGEKLSES